MAATASSAANGVPPPTGGELANSDRSAASSNGTTSNGANNGKNGSTSGSGGAQSNGNGNAPKKSAANGRPAAKKSGAKESGDQISVTEQARQSQRNGDGHKDEKDNKSKNDDVAVVNSSDQQSRQPRSSRKGGLNQELRERIKQAYQAKTVNLLVRYNKLGSQFADFANNVAFLSRCAKMSMVPKTHRVYNTEIRNTRIVVRILDQCCYKIMMADLDHNRRRKFQVRKNREKIEQRLKQILTPQDFEEIQKICEENKEQHFSDVKEKQRQEFDELMDEYKSNEVTRRLESRRGRRTLSSDQGSETGDEQGYRDSRSADPQPVAAQQPAAASAAVKEAPKELPKESPNESPKEQPASENGGTANGKKDNGAPAAPKTPKETKAKAAPVGKDSAKVASSSKK